MEDKERKVIEAACIIAEYAENIEDCHTCLFYKWCGLSHDPTTCIVDILDWIED